MRLDLPLENCTVAVEYGFKKIIPADGRLVKGDGEVLVSLTIPGKTVKVGLPCIIIRTMVLNVDVILGTDVLRHFNVAMNYGKFSVSADADASESLSNNLPAYRYQYYQFIKNIFEVRFDGQPPLV